MIYVVVIHDGSNSATNATLGIKVVSGKERWYSVPALKKEGFGRSYRFGQSVHAMS